VAGTDPPLAGAGSIGGGGIFHAFFMLEYPDLGLAATVA
jgi:hypothetical protein